MEIGANIYPSVHLSRLRLNITIVWNLAYRSLIFSKGHKHLLYINHLQPLGPCENKSDLQLQATFFKAS